jgi:DNA-binding IclR family transcriptional regulator
MAADEMFVRSPFHGRLGGDRMTDRGPTGGDGAGVAAARDFRPVKSAYRALDVLETIASGGPASLSELSRRLGIPKSSLHGLLHTLIDRGWVTPADGGTRFRLGLRALQVGTRFVDEDEVVSQVAPSLDRLAAVTGETIQHARLDEDQVVYLAKRDTAHPVRIISSIGTRLPAHATALGKALLAVRDDEEVHRLLHPPLRALTPHTLTDPEALAANLHHTRARGYAVDEGEAAEGLRCFAVVVPQPGGVRRGSDGTPTDAISVSVPTFRLDDDREERLVAALLEEQARLGGPVSR